MGTTTVATWTKCFLTSKNLFESTCSNVVLVSTYCRLGISTSVSESESAASSASTDDKTATVQYKPVTSLSRYNTLAYYSHLATIKYHKHYPIFMTFAGAAVIFLMSYPYTF